MIKVNCSELSGTVKLALAEAISVGLGGKGVALLEGDNLAIDVVSGPAPGVAQIQALVQSHLSGRKDASAYSVESEGNVVVVHSSVPVTAAEKRKEGGLPPGLHQCPVCGYVTSSQNEYEVHLRMHDLVRGIA